MKGAQESRDTGAASLDKGVLLSGAVLVQLDGRRAVVCSFFPPATPQRTRQRGERGLQGGLQGGYKGEGGSQGVYRRKEGRGAGQEELNGQVSVDLSRAYKHQA